MDQMTQVVYGKNYLGQDMSCYVEKTELYCPNCGVKSIWEENSDGDYYQGPQHYCRSCKVSFTVSMGTPNNELIFKE